jgi:hypothetical protein
MTTKDIVVSLFDKTGNMVRPWADAGYTCYIVDLQHQMAADQPEAAPSSVHKVYWDLTTPWVPPFDRSRIAFVSAFPPCDHLAVSGSRWFKGKGLRALSHSVSLFATAAEFCEWSEAPYFIENPVSTISTYWRKPDYTFSPHQYTQHNANDNYTKKTCLWVGNGFKMPPEASDVTLGEPDDRIHKCSPGPDRANIRSATPMGFAKAVFASNAINCKQREENT